MSGAVSVRFRLATPIARTWFSLIWPCMVASASIIIEGSPAMTSMRAWLLDLYGTCWMSIPVMDFRCSIGRW